MGYLRFQVPPSLAIDERFWGTAIVSGIEGIPWKCHVRFQDDTLEIDRSIDESGKLSLVWPTQEYGPLTLTSTSLRCGKEVYQLPLELARGTLHRVRGRALDWQRLGLKLPDTFCRLAEAALDSFLSATLRQNALDQFQLSHRSIEFALAASRPLTQAYIQQSLGGRHSQETLLSTLLGIRLETSSEWLQSSEMILPAMNLACLGLDWGKIEADSGRANYDVFDQQFDWARKNNLRVCGGPLISLQPSAMPNWLYLLDDFESLLDAACTFARKTVLRYKGRVHLWSAAAGLNSPNDLGLTDEQVLRLAVGVIQTIRRADDRTPVVLHLDLPWAEYLGQNENAISPFHLADAINRANLGLSGLGLDFNMNYSPGGSPPRDLIDLSDLVDHWSELGLPLIATVNTPAQLAVDSKANAKIGYHTSWSHSLPAIEDPSLSKNPLPVSGMDIVQMLLCKPNVHGIVWGQVNDRTPHHFPNAGLFDGNGRSRPALESLIRMKKEHLQAT